MKTNIWKKFIAFSMNYYIIIRQIIGSRIDKW
jgi:hypothetical protein